MLGNFGEHARAYVLAAVKGKIRPASAGKGTVRTGLALDMDQSMPTNATKTRLTLVDGQLLTQCWQR